MVELTIKNISKMITFLRYRFNYLINYIFIGFFSVLLEVLIVNNLGKLGMPFYFNVIVGFGSGVLVSFLLNSKLNFKVPKSQNTRTFFLFVTISTIAFVLNILLMKVLITIINASYGLLRFVTAGCIFMVSYLAHRRITFKFLKNVGIAVYLSKNQSISEVYSKIRNYADFVHLDLVDNTFSKEAKEVDLSIIKEVDKTWALEKMLHIMSKTPSIWINKMHQHVNTIIFHLDIDESVREIVKLCKRYGKKVGIALTLDSSLDEIIPYLRYLNFVQLMGISDLGKTGRFFEPASLTRLAELNKLRRKFNFEIIFDGGVKPTNIGRINAKYIVSSSGLLSSNDPVRAFMELKTSARYRDVRNELRKDIIKSVETAIDSLDFVESGTIVGSFAENNSLAGVSDIDIVIIADKLNEKKFNLIVDKFKKEKKKLESNYGYDVYINTSFGPLKYHNKNIVFHLMIYDCNSHRLHCQRSPFTCFDWQRSRLYFKKPMTEIYKVRIIEPNFFLSARRSAEEYLSEIKKNVVSYREYSFDKQGKVFEEKKEKVMTDKDKIEFAHHIIKFLIINFLKLCNGENKTYSLDERISLYFKLFPLKRREHIKLIKDIDKLKKEMNYDKIPSNLIGNLESFIRDFEGQLKAYFYENSKQILFLRHCKTKLNKKNRFLGQRSDPGIIKPDSNTVKKLMEDFKDANIVFSSPLIRCQNTVRLFYDGPTKLDGRLKELDCGLVDGKTFSYVSANYPEIIEDWKAGNDPRFPEGENFQDVAIRLRSFLRDLTDIQSNKAVVCTHNCVLRALLGMHLKVPIKQWYKFVVPHLEPLKFVMTNDKKIYIDLTAMQINEILKDFKNG